MKTSTTDEQLVRAAVAGDQGALLDLYQCRLPLVRAVVRRAVHNAQDAEDVVQQVWLEAAGSVHAFASHSSFSTWLVTLAKRAAYNAYSRSVRQGSDWLISKERDANPTAAILLGIDLDRAMSRLPVSYRRTLIAHDLEGYSHREIAKKHQISTGTSKAYLHRARLACRKHLEHLI